MVIGRITGGPSPTPGAPPPLTPELGAAGLIVMAAHRDGVSTEVERQEATAALMKLLHLPGPKAAALRADAEAAEAAGLGEAALAAAAAALPADEREQLVTCLWSLSRLGPDDAATTVLSAAAAAFDYAPERMTALRPRRS